MNAVKFMIHFWLAGLVFASFAGCAPTTEEAGYEMPGDPFESTYRPLPSETTLIKDAVILTRFAVRARYPGASAPVTRNEHEQAISLADAVVAWAHTQVLGADEPG